MSGPIGGELSRVRSWQDRNIVVTTLKDWFSLFVLYHATPFFL
jgi:hypothetical protein